MSVGLVGLGDHAFPELFDGRAVALLDGAHQVGLGAEVVADGGVVALPGGLADLPVGDGEDAVFGEEPFGGGQDRLPGGAGPLGAQGSWRWSCAQSTPSTQLSQAIDLIRGRGTPPHAGRTRVRASGLRGGMTLPATVPPSTGSTVPGHVARAVAGEVQRGLGDVVRRALPLQRPVVAHLLADPGLELLQPLAVLGAGRDSAGSASGCCPAQCS